MFPKAFSPWNPLKKFSQDLYSEKSTSGNTSWRWKREEQVSVAQSLCASVFCELETVTKHTQIPLHRGTECPRPPLPSPAVSLGGGVGGWPPGVTTLPNAGRLFCGFCNNGRIIVSRMPRTHFQPSFFLKLREWEIIWCFCKKAFLKDPLNVIF